MKIVSVPTMQLLDRETIAAGTPAAELMERAGLGAFREIGAYIRDRLGAGLVRRLTVLAGKGNNGGDAHVVARLFAENTGLEVALFSVCPLCELTGAARYHADRLPAGVAVTVCGELPATALEPGGLVVDGLLGTGMSGPPREPSARIISQVNASGLPVAALDIPSGLDADSGHVGGEAVVADLTVTMGFPKRGMFAAAGPAHCGALRVVDIGIPAALADAEPDSGDATFAEDIRPLLGRRPHDTHKGACGRLLVAGGCLEYTGAPLLAGAGALRCGTGLVTVAMPAAARAVARPPLLALILRGVEDNARGCFADGADTGLEALASQADAAVCGPGLGAAAHVNILEFFLNSPLPLVLDADALRLLAANPHLAAPRRAAATVLTPHPGEMRALLDGLNLGAARHAAREDQALALAGATGFHVVLKGAGTVVADPDGCAAVNTSGNNSLATAGTGDVLAGMIGGWLAQGLPAFDAARLAVFVHGRAAEIGSAGSHRALVADDLPALIGPALRELTPFP